MFIVNRVKDKALSVSKEIVSIGRIVGRNVGTKDNLIAITGIAVSLMYVSCVYLSIDSGIKQNRLLGKQLKAYK